MADVIFKLGSSTNLSSVEKVDGQLLFTTDEGAIYLDYSSGASVERVKLYLKDVNKLQGLIDTINGNSVTEGSIAHAVDEMKKVLVGAAEDTGDKDTIKGAKKYCDNLKDSLKTIATSGMAKDVTIEDTAGVLSATNVEDALNELFVAIGTGGTGSVVTIEKDESAEGVAARYTFKQGGIPLPTTIDIPKDMVVSSGSVKTVDTPDQPYSGAAVGDKYIELVLSDASSTKLYIPAKDLVEFVTGGIHTEGMITTEVDSNHVLTAKLVDGTVTKAKLDSGVTASLDKADSAVQPEELKVEEEAGKYISSIEVDGSGTITVKKKELPKMTWGSFTDLIS